MMETVSIKSGKKTFKIRVKKLSSAGKYLGLMFKPKNTENLLFQFSKPSRTAIHSYFVFFPFAAIWLDSKNNVI